MLLVLGTVQFAELKFPAPSVMRGPGEIGVLARSDLQFEKLWLKIEDGETQGLMMSTIAVASVEGYSAERELMKVPSGSLFPRKLKWFSWEH